MSFTHSVVATFGDHEAAEAAIRRLTSGGFPMKNLSIVGKGRHLEEKVIGFYDTGDRIRFWGARGAFWGGLWGLFFGGVFVTVPAVGEVMALGLVANAVISAVEGAVIGGGLGVLGAGLYGIGIPKDSVLRYETSLRGDGFLVMAHGSAAVVGRARDILEGGSPTQIDVHLGGRPFRKPIALIAAPV